MDGFTDGWIYGRMFLVQAKYLLPDWLLKAQQQFTVVSGPNLQYDNDLSNLRICEFSNTDPREPQKWPPRQKHVIALDLCLI